MEIIIKNNSGFKWYNNSRVYVKGYVVDKEGVCYKGDSLIDIFNRLQTKDDFINMISEVSGSFAVIIKSNDYIWCAVDRIRSIPLFYSHSKNGFIISDSAYELVNDSNKLLDKVAINEFLFTGFVTGNSTFIQNIKQMIAGEYLIIEDDNISISQYYKFKYKLNKSLSYTKLLSRLKEVNINIFKEIIKTLDNRTVVVPLSGGYDSRLILYMLKELQYKDVICYTYGKKNNIESRISKMVAESFGYKWNFVEYKRKNIYSLFNSKEMEKYHDYSCNLSSLPITQEWYAIKYLLDKNIIPKNSIVIPGYSADFLEGTHLDKSLNNKKICTDALIKKHYNLREIKDENIEIINSKINDKLNYMEKDLNNKDYSEMYERFNFEERQSKYITNAIRTYEFFGLEWRLPFWSKEFIEFWCSVPLEFREDRKLYLDYAKKYQEEYYIKRNIKNILKKRFDFKYNYFYYQFNGDNSFVKSLFQKEGKEFTISLLGINDENKKIYKQHCLYIACKYNIKSFLNNHLGE